MTLSNTAPSDAARETIHLDTEARNPRTLALDTVPTVELLGLLNDEDARVAAVVRTLLPTLARLVDAAALALESGGRVHYFGAGTSGRLAVLDATELLPTFNLEPGIVVAHMAGGPAALIRSAENVEDSPEAGARDAAEVGAGDIAIGITASGRTPYVRGALAEARRRGAVTAVIANNPGSVIGAEVDYALEAATGPEALSGSTRLKSGTAAKFLLNGFSTALMVRRGFAWSNLMVSVVPSNEKLRERAVRILMAATDLDRAAAGTLLAACDGDIKTAILSRLAGIPPAEARTALGAAHGSVARALPTTLPPTTHR